MKFRLPASRLTERFGKAIGLLLFTAILVSAWPALLAGQTQPEALDVALVHGQVPMAEHIAVLRDAGAQFTLADVLAPEHAAQFVPITGSEPSFGPTGDAAWVRVHLRNSAPDPKDVVLDLELTAGTFVDFYGPVVNGAETEVIRTGARMPYSSRPLAGRTFAFPIHLDGGAEGVYYLRVWTDFALRLPLTLWPAASFAANVVQEEIAWVIVVGFILLLALYHLLVFVVVRDRDHLLLAIAITMSMAATLVPRGFASRWLGEWSVYFPQIMVALITGAAIAYLVFVISFLQLRQRVPWAFRLFLAIMVIVLAAGVFGLAFNLRFGYQILIACSTAMLLIILVVTVIEARQGYRPAIYFLIAELFPIALGLAQSVSLLGVAPWAPPYVSDLPISDLLLVVLLSLALADRINMLRKEAEQTKRALAASESRIRDYLNALPFFVQVYDPNLELEFSNRTVQQESFSELPKIDGNYRIMKERFPVLKYGHDTPYPEEQLPIMRAARGETAHADDLCVVFPDGERIMEAWSVPIKNEVGATTAIVTAFQDITERRAIESELASYRDHLEQRVHQRTTDLAAANHALRARIAELSAINEISQTILHRSKLEPTFQRVAEILTELYGVSIAGVALLHPEQKEFQLVCLRYTRQPDFEPPQALRIPYGALHGAVIFQTQPFIVSDPGVMAQISDLLGLYLGTVCIKQALFAPLLSPAGILGVLAVASTDNDRLLDASDLSTVQTIASQVAAVLEVSRLFAEEQFQRQMADALRITANALSRSLDEDTVLATVLQQLRHVLEYEGAAISLVDEAELVLVATEGLSQRYRGRRILLAGDTASAVVLRSGEPLLIADTYLSKVWEPWSTDNEIRSWLGVPLVASGEPIGVLNLDSTRVAAFSQTQADLLLTFANQAAIAVANARLHRQAQHAAAASERERIARDLHDAVTQSIFSASLIAGALPAQLPDVGPAVRDNLVALEKLTQGALAELRAMLLELRPEHLIATPLEQLISQLAQAFTGRMGMPINVTVNGEAQYKPPPAVHVAVYRIAQEALNNVAHHAQAENVTVNLVLRKGAIRLSVLDDGRGFDMQTRAPGRLGIAIMSDRAAEIGAELTIDSAPGMGTQIFLVWSERIG